MNIYHRLKNYLNVILIFNPMTNEKKEQVIHFFKTIINGIVLSEIKDEKKQNLIFRNLKNDIATLKSILDK